MSVSQLVAALDTLIQALNEDGKPSASFFADRAAELRQPNLGNAALRENIEPLATCMAMAQYGDFSPAQEALLGKVVDLAGACLAAIPAP